MRLLTLLLLPAALLAGPTRFARLGEFQGQVEVQLTAADAWMPAERNLPLSESAWLRTGEGAQVEIELDDGSAWRVGPGSLAELSDYTRLSTGQRITVLSLDHGTAYFTGQPQGKDVTLLVLPGAQAAVLQGSRIRVNANPGVSQVSVLEGQVRFSSPIAELDLREGNTVRIQPGNMASFVLEPEVKVAPLDRWSEDRDKLEAGAASASYVTARYGAADLDAAGKWVSNEDLGVVWKPDVADTWAPYQNGRWRYLDPLGYTWVSGDSWGWLPYHNGRWAKVDKVGWVWQPAVSAIFHPGEVYWLKGANFTGWGPLAPGEQWNSPDAGTVTPRWYTAGSTSYASFQPDARMVDGTGFAAPTAEQMKTAVFLPALPSPAFLTARLDAVRPVLQVGKTRVLPSVPGVTFGDAPPCDVYPPPMPVQAPPTVADAGAIPPPDGVYPVPAVAVPVIEVPVMVNAPSHPDYARPSGVPKSGGTSSVPTPVAATPPIAEPKPFPRPPQNSPPAISPGHVPPKPNAPPVEPPKKFVAAVLSEPDYHRMVLKDIDPAGPHFDQALKDLDAWTKGFPKSASQNDRLYYYIHVYDSTGNPALVLQTAAPLVQAGVRSTFADEQQVLQILVAAASSVQKTPKLDAQQLATGKKAAKDLLEFLPIYFNPRRKPAKLSDGDWSLMRVQLEGIARDALAHMGAKGTAVN